ncbi:structural maintenance of chromosomes flexible hinge domain-containing protein GMI1 [Tanacetum coccineum]
MENKRSNLTPLKRLKDVSDTDRLSKKPTPNIVTGYRKLKILLPNGMTVLVKLNENLEFIYDKELVNKVKAQYDRVVESRKGLSTRRSVNWDNEGVCFLDDYDNKLKKKVKLNKLSLDRVYNLRLDDGSKPADIYENMWDLTPDTELLRELPEEYTFETALADLIDNSLQAVWSNEQNDRRLIRVEVSEEKISIFDTGPGMDDNNIEKWGKMGASLHRVQKTQAIGGKPPYLKPSFGMYGYGGFIASMHLGRHTEVSSKTKKSKKVFMLRLQRDALVRGSGSKQTWRTSGSVRDPSGDELELSPDGSFTKVDIYEPNMKNIDIRRLKCKLKDIYFPYIQCDNFSKGKTVMPIEFQVNDNDLAEILGGEVAITNMHSCNGPEFVLQLHFELNHDIATTTSSPGPRSSQEANARLRCVYLPVKEGKETIETILETLKEDGLGYKEEVGSFSRISCRRLGRLLPDARWTDFAPQNPYATALRNLGSKSHLERENGVRVDIIRDGKSLTPVLLDKQYRQWLLDMHDQYDEEAEADCGTDDPVIIINPAHKKELHISSNVVRVHKSVRWKGKSWISGQRIKILKGACAGFYKNNVYATLEYILLEGFQGDTGGEAWIICRAIDVLEKNGAVLDSVDGNPNFDLRESVSIPMNVIKSGKCVAVDDSEWGGQLDKQNQKVPSSIEMLTSKQCCELGIETLPDGSEFHACNLSSCEVVAVVRPANYKSRTPTEPLEQKFVMKDNFGMSLAITYSKSKKSQDESIYSGRVTPSSRRNINGLYVFQPKCKSHPLFRRAGVYTFTFFIKDSSCDKCVVKVRVKASEVHRWALTKKSHHNIRLGCPCEPISVSMFDEFDNQLPFLKVPELVIKIKQTNGTRNSVQVKQWNPSTSLDKSALIIEDLLIESFNLDDLRPSYDATMMLFLQDGSHLLDIPIKVLPGPIKRFTVQPENFEKHLIPGQVIKELTLEFFDVYGNRIQENEKVELSLNGFGWVDRLTSNKVSGVYHCPVSNHRIEIVVLTKEWQIDKRKLRAAQLYQKAVFAGSQLKTSFMDIDESVKYVFREGRCVVRAVPVPDEEGEFNFVVAHSRYPDEPIDIRFLLSFLQRKEPSVNLYIKFLRKTISSQPIDSISRDGMSLVQYDLERYHDNMKKSSKFLDESDFRSNWGSPRAWPKLGWSSHESVSEKVITRSSLLAGNIIGIVALLSPYKLPTFRALFAEYLGDQMLAVVCKSYRDVCLIDTYEKSGKFKREQLLDIFPTELRESVNGRYHVLCLENISPCKAKKDRLGKILLPDPTLPNGSTPAGFVGYAVNLIEVDADHVDTKIGCGYGLRETLFYRLFGKTQVYESKEELKSAIHCIKDGAISLDGGIIRGNGAVYLGCLEPDIIFPVIAPRSQVISQQAMQVMKRRSELKLKLKKTKE